MLIHFFDKSEGSRRIRHFFLSISILVVFSGCQPVVKLLYGIRNPKVENQESLTKYMVKKDIRIENTYTTTFEQFPNALDRIKKTLPEVLIFNQQGDNIPYGEEWACNASAFSFIEQLRTDSAYSTNEEIVLSSALKGLAGLDGTPVELKDSENHDFTILIYWARYVGKLNKNHVNEWEKQAFQNQSAKLRVIKVNMDFQQHWGPENLAKISGK